MARDYRWDTQPYFPSGDWTDLELEWKDDGTVVLSGKVTLPQSLHFIPIKIGIAEQACLEGSIGQEDPYLNVGQTDPLFQEYGPPDDEVDAYVPPAYAMAAIPPGYGVMNLPTVLPSGWQPVQGQTITGGPKLPISKNSPNITSSGVLSDRYEAGAIVGEYGRLGPNDPRYRVLQMRPCGDMYAGQYEVILAGL